MFNFFRTHSSVAIFRTSDSLHITCGLSLGTAFVCKWQKWILAWAEQDFFFFFTLKIGLETSSLGLILYGWLHTILPRWSSLLSVPSSSTHGFYLWDLPRVQTEGWNSNHHLNFPGQSRGQGNKGWPYLSRTLLEISCNTSASISLAKSSSLWGRLGNVVFWAGYLAISNKIRILLLMRKDFYS